MATDETRLVEAAAGSEMSKLATEVPSLAPKAPEAAAKTIEGFEDPDIVSAAVEIAAAPDSNDTIATMEMSEKVDTVEAVDTTEPVDEIRLAKTVETPETPETVEKVEMVEKDEPNDKVETVETPDTTEAPDTVRAPTTVEIPQTVAPELIEEDETIEPVETIKTVEKVEQVEQVETVVPVKTIEVLETPQTVSEIEMAETAAPIEKAEIEIVETPETCEKAELVEPAELVETLETPETVEKVEAVSKVETKTEPIKNSGKVETVETIEPIDKVANVEIPEPTQLTQATEPTELAKIDSRDEPNSQTAVAVHCTQPTLLHKAKSTADLPIIKADRSEPDSASSTPLRRLPSSLSSSSLDEDRSTIPDPRKRGLASPSATDSFPPEDEVTALSTKLINAINYQSTLDDSLSQARMELEQARERIQTLEAMRARQEQFLKSDVWVRRSTVDQEMAELQARIREEKALRAEAEQAKKKMEFELETLTAELFQEANKMVTDAKEAARNEELAANKRYEGLRAQLVDTEGLLKSQQEQLAQLKLVMEEIITSQPSPRDDFTTLTTPTSPGFGHFDDKDSKGDSDSYYSEAAAATSAEFKALEAFGADSTQQQQLEVVDIDASSSTGAAVVAKSEISATAPATATAPPPLEPPSPSQPMSYSHLLRPILRYDIGAYSDFVELIRVAQYQILLAAQQQLYHAQAQAHERSPSSTSLPKTPPLTAVSFSPANNSSNMPNAPLTVITTTATVNGSSPQQNVRDLKESKFYKRVLVEDIEPTLRLDTAPGLFWLARRSIMSAILEGTLVAEPVAHLDVQGQGTSSGIITSACTLCGESRQQEPYLRRHRFRMSESDKSTPYPLCDYCLGRVRSVCGFLVFLRMIKDGHWRADDEDAEHNAWEECVRLREQMFWARIGGGMVPAGSTGGSGLHSVRHTRMAGGGSGSSSSVMIQQGFPASSPAVHSSVTALVSSPLSSPPMAANSGLGIVSSSGASISSVTSAASTTATSATATPTVTSVERRDFFRPNRSSMLSTSMAAFVTGLGGHL